jgi:anti-anti-sigma regulatory factor
MIKSTRVVTVKHVPAAFDANQERMFLRELEDCLNVSRPCIVLDCSVARQMDPSIVRMLLCCLEEAMKRNGDVRLSGVAPEAITVLKRYAVDRLFKIFATNEDAIESYRRPPGHPAAQVCAMDDGPYPATKNAV